MRAYAASLFLILAACGAGTWGRGDSVVWGTLPAAPDSVLRIAATQLHHHGYSVLEVSGGEVLTRPGPIPPHLRGGDDPAERHWFIRVSAERLRFSGGTQVTIAGYTVPPEADGTNGDLIRKGSPVSERSHPRLFGEVRAAAEWISDAVKRSYPR